MARRWVGYALLFLAGVLVCSGVLKTYPAGADSFRFPGAGLVYYFDTTAQVPKEVQPAQPLPARLGDGTNNNLLGSAANLAAATANGAVLAERGPRWSVVSTPAAGSQGTASKGAGAAGVRHVADCLSIGAGAIVAPAATLLTVNLRDGATGAGTIIWSKTLNIAATVAQHAVIDFCGLNLIGTAATAMTLEFAAGLTSEAEAVTLTGYDVN